MTQGSLWVGTEFVPEVEESQRRVLEAETVRCLLSAAF